MKRVPLVLEVLAAVAVVVFWVWTSFVSDEAAPLGLKLLGTTSTAIVLALLLDVLGGRLLEKIDPPSLVSDRRRRLSISRHVRDAVWRRDEGRCQWREGPGQPICGSQERLEFDHIIPWSKGGPDTERNLQL